MKEKYIGTRAIRPDTLAKVTGAARFTADLAVHRTDLLYAKALYPPYAHAKILAIDTSEAEKAPGVVCVMTSPSWRRKRSATRETLSRSWRRRLSSRRRTPSSW